MAEAGSNESLQVQVGADGVIVAVGDIDVAGGPLVDAAILEGESEQPVIIDLTEVTFIDSSGLRSLLSASRRAGERGTEVVLRSPSAAVRRLLEITGTEGQFRIEGGAG
ncbi:MAG: anti-sigma-factor antagonist [Ilumatobacteraceae bacterium]|nr:anti-sigma-factor antagonist [Ilumatobacteraceae bacterium]